MTAFDEAWEVAKGVSDFELAAAKEYAPQDMEEGRWDREVRDIETAENLDMIEADEFHRRWAEEDSCACTTEDEEADELEAAYMAKHGITDPHEIDWMDDEVHPAGYRRSSKWMKHGPTYIPNQNVITASCGHCGVSSALDLVYGDWEVE
tara:strand:- start:45 stop:494 length:450 start_codon:yes stop_codon:yes gene_type:complete